MAAKVKFSGRALFLRAFVAVICCCSASYGQNADRHRLGGEISIPSLINTAELKRLISERHGRVLFLNVWATWCEPCTQEFPDIIKLSAAYSKRAVDFVAVSVDYPDEAKSKVLPFMRDHNIRFPVYVADAKHQDDFINALDSSWSGAVPASFIFDTLGEQRTLLIGQKNFAIFKTEIDTVLNFR